jgi:hypothetical protein
MKSIEMLELYKKTASLAKVAREFHCSREWVRQVIKNQGFDIRAYRRQLFPARLPKKRLCGIWCSYCKGRITKHHTITRGMHQNCYRKLMYHTQPIYKTYGEKYYWLNKPRYQQYNRNCYIRRKYKALNYFVINYLLQYV